jgi:hypothetical protein
MAVAGFDILGTYEVFAGVCSPIDATIVVSGGKDGRWFLWMIGTAENVHDLTSGLIHLVVLLGFLYSIFFCKCF